MKITHHKNGEIKTLVEEAPYHPGYEDAGFKPKVVNNEPVAWIVMDVDNGKSLQFEENKFAEINIPLYTHPVKELNDGGEPVKNATYWKRQYNLMASQNDNLKSGLYHANEQIKYLEAHPVKELTDKEIDEISKEVWERPWLEVHRKFAKAILRKAQEK